MRPALPSDAAREPSPGDSGFPFSARPAVSGHDRRRGTGGPVTSPPPWHESARDHRAATRRRAATPAEAAAPAKPKRNLLFSSSSRKERERTQARTSEPIPPDLMSPDLAESAGRTAAARTGRTAAGDIRRCLAETGAMRGPANLRRSGVARERPRRLPSPLRRVRRGSSAVGTAQRGPRR